ncbi:SpoIIE family protein phosphatase [bacterium]|nr:SpoIIE family protein phosphatase [bacterium]
MASKHDEVIGKLLVVDDNEANRDTLSRRLKRAGHDVDVADGGQVALQMIAETPYDVILLDVMMPEVDGFEVLKQVRETTPADHLPIIMATAKTDSDTIVDALEMGANDYVTKPLDFPVVRARVQTQLALKKARESLADAHDRMKHDLEAAAEVQMATLPAEIEIEGYDFAWQFFPCDELGGDGLNIVPLSDKEVMVCLWDVCGHGVPAALLSVSVARMLGASSSYSELIHSSENGDNNLAPPRLVAERLNERFQMSDNASRFFTTCYGILDTQTGTFRYTSAGHPAPIHVLNDGSIKANELPGFPIGVTESVEGGFGEAEIVLAPGDRLFIYSDGFEEQSNQSEDLFGIPALQDELKNMRTLPAKEVAGKLYQKLLEWSGAEKLSDDASIIVVQRNLS